MKLLSENIAKLYFISAIFAGAIMGLFIGLHFAGTNSLYVLFAFQLILLIRWFRLDNIKRGYTDIPDRGMFLMMGGHILLPLYVLWTRKFKGLWYLFLAILCYVVPMAVVAIIMQFVR